jgi:hypothetical protein
MRRRRARNKAKVQAAYGGRCVCCGEAEPAFLVLDHVNGGGRQHLLQAGNTDMIYREVLAAGCPADYRLLCYNCNSGRSVNGGLCPHEVILRALVAF